MVELVRQSAFIPRVVRRLRRPWTRYLSRRDLQRYTTFSHLLLAQLVQNGKLTDIGPSPIITRTLITRSGVVVATIASQGSMQPQAVLKLPLSVDALGSLQRHRRVVTTLHAIPALHTFSAFVPKALAWGEYDSQAYYVETAIPGQVAQDLLKQPAMLQQVVDDAAHAILQLHIHTLRWQVIDDAAFARLAGNDITLLRQCAVRWPETALLARKIDQLEELLRAYLQGAELPLTWIHGDFWLGNLLIDTAAGGFSGVIDWDRASPNEIPLHDLFHLLVYTRKLVCGTELGEEVVDYLLPGGFTASEQALVETALKQLGLPRGRDALRAMSLLYWLRVIAANLSRYPDRQTDMTWLGKNVLLVLKRGL